jgi:hypothetical protein
MCTCRADTSHVRTFERIEQLIRQRLEKGTGDGESALGEPDRTRLNRGFRQGCNLSNGMIAFTQQNPLSRLQFRQILGEVSLGLVYVQFNHVVMTRPGSELSQAGGVPFPVAPWHASSTNSLSSEAA